MQLFSAEAKVFSKFFKKISDPKNMKNRPPKLLIIGPQLLLMFWFACPNGPKTEILYHPKAP